MPDRNHRWTQMHTDWPGCSVAVPQFRPGGVGGVIPRPGGLRGVSRAPEKARLRWFGAARETENDYENENDPRRRAVESRRERRPILSFRVFRAFRG